MCGLLQKYGIYEKNSENYMADRMDSSLLCLTYWQDLDKDKQIKLKSGQLRNDQNLKTTHKSPPGPWPVCFTVGVGGWATFGGLAPNPRLTSPLYPVSPVAFDAFYSQCRHQEFSYLGRRSCNPEVPQWGSGTKHLVGGLGTRFPRSWSSLQTLFTDFDCRANLPYCFKLNRPSTAV